MIAGYTKKKCSGCGSVTSLRPGTVCGSCQQAIMSYPELKARAGLMDASRLRQYFIGERTGIPSGIYSMSAARDFAEAMSSLLRVVGQATPNQQEQRFHNSSIPEPSFITMLEVEHRDRNRSDFRIHLPEGTTEALRALYLSIQMLVQEAEAKGQQKGRQLLLQLNSGELSVADFNEAAIRNDSKFKEHAA